MSVTEGSYDTRSSPRAWTPGSFETNGGDGRAVAAIKGQIGARPALCLRPWVLPGRQTGAPPTAGRGPHAQGPMVGTWQKWDVGPHRLSSQPLH